MASYNQLSVLYIWYAKIDFQLKNTNSKKIGLNFYTTWSKEPHCTAPICVRWRLRLYIHHLDGQYNIVFMVGRDRERGRNAKCVTIEDKTWLHVYDHGNITYQAVGVIESCTFWFLPGTGKDKLMDPNKWVIYKKLMLPNPPPSRHSGTGIKAVWKQ